MKGSGCGNHGPGAVIANVERQGLYLGRFYIAVLLFQKSGRLFGHEMQYKTEEKGGAFTFDQVKAQAFQFAPGTKLISAVRRGILFVSVEFFVHMAVDGIGTGSADHRLFQQKRFKGIGYQKMIHKLFHGSNL